MNRKLLMIAVVLGFVFTSCGNDPKSKIKKENVELAKKRDYEMKYESPVMKFTNTEYDFGTIDEGDIVETTFKFKNTGKKELIISHAKASCGCTIPEWPKKPIMPGEEGVIKVKFNSDHKPNKQQKQITLTTNTNNGKELLMIKAFVNPKPKK